MKFIILQQNLNSNFVSGVGQFTIVDGEKVTGEDVGNNFFLETGTTTDNNIEGHTCHGRFGLRVEDCLAVALSYVLSPYFPLVI